MHRQGFDLKLPQYDERGWRATFYTTGMEHSPTSATGTGWESTFMGVSGVAPARQQVEAWTKREGELMTRGGMVFPPDAAGAIPASGPAATRGLRTLPPRENGGNFDVKQLSKGAKLLLPVAVEGALFSTG